MGFFSNFRVSNKFDNIFLTGEYRFNFRTFGYLLTFFNGFILKTNRYIYINIQYALQQDLFMDILRSHMDGISTPNFLWLVTSSMAPPTCTWAASLDCLPPQHGLQLHSLTEPAHLAVHSGDGPKKLQGKKDYTIKYTLWILSDGIHQWGFKNMKTLQIKTNMFVGGNRLEMVKIVLEHFG